jgi:hypothetical protein
MLHFLDRARITAATVSLLVLSVCQADAQAIPTSLSGIRGELDALYVENHAAFVRGDVAGVMRLRHPDFHTITPDGARHDRSAMEERTRGFINAVQKWNTATITIDSLQVGGDTAHAIVSQHLDRMALREDKQVHRVQTWVTQRETWIRSGESWLLWRVDRVGNTRRVIDGRAQ